MNTRQNRKAKQERARAMVRDSDFPENIKEVMFQILRAPTPAQVNRIISECESRIKNAKD